MTPDRRTLVEASQTIDRLLEAYQLPLSALTEPADDTQRAAVDALTPVLTQVLATHEVDLAGVLSHLTAPTGDTVADLVELADQLLKGETRTTYLSKLKFFRDGWCILPEQLDDAIAAAKQAELRIELSANPDDHPQIDQPVPGGKTPHRHLVLWPGYGHEPIERVRRFKIELAGKYKRADTLTLAAGRDRKRAEKGQPPLGWTGDGAVDGLYAALSYLYGLARGEGIIDVTTDPLADIKSPDRGETNRRPLTRTEITSLWHTVALHAPDPALDRLLVKFFFHTGARRDGAINLTVGMLNFERQSVTLVQKYGKATEVPVCRSLLEELAAFAASRGSTNPDDPVFRLDSLDRSTGQLRPLSDKHFDSLHDDIRDHCDWAREEGWTVHWVRHHAKAEMHDIGGPAVARQFMGHSAAHVTERYGPASFEHVAWAVSVRTGEPHPMAVKPHWLS
jgi:integrase